MLVFWLLGLAALVSKMAFFVIVIISDLTQVFVIFFKWLVKSFPSRKIGCIDPKGWAGALRPWAAIIMVFFIMFTLFVISSKSLEGVGILETVRKQGFKLLRSGRILVKNLLFGAFIYCEGRLMVSRAMSIYFSDPRQKVESEFGFCSNGFFNNFLSNVFLATILIGIGIDR